MKNELLKNKYSVLVIDDQDNWRELLSEVLEDRFEVMSAKDYDGALDAIGKQKPPFHVVVTDMRLRDEEVGNEYGLKLIADLNKLGDETKTILVTGYPTIATAKRALSQLAVYDYLEKHPSDGSGFDIGKFKHAVYAAAQEAEQQRPSGITDVNCNILLLEPDPVWRRNLEDILQKDGYKVMSIQQVEDLVFQLESIKQEFALIIINESLSNELVLSTLRRLNSGGNIILITPENINNIFNMMREYPVLSAFSMPDGEINIPAFQELIHSALSNGAMKYISVFIQPQDQSAPISPCTNGMKILANRPYIINLLLQDIPLSGATKIFVLPKAQKKDNIYLRLFVHASQMKVEPGTEANWTIPLSNKRPNNCVFLINPQGVGRRFISIEVHQNMRWLARISLNFEVIDE